MPDAIRVNNVVQSNPSADVSFVLCRDPDAVNLSLGVCRFHKLMKKPMKEKDASQMFKNIMGVLKNEC